jgi:hypothetical protein
MFDKKKSAASEMRSVGASAGNKMVDISRKTQSPNKLQGTEEI